MPTPEVPAKPSSDFPLFAYRNGQWSKAMGPRGHQKVISFGPWDDPQGALANYQQYLADQAKKPVPKAQQKKPKPPTDDFPLFAHQNGQWAKTVLGKTHYFGPWAEPGKALIKWLREKDALLNGLTPENESGACTLGQVTHAYLEYKRGRVAAGEIGQKTYDDYKRDCDRLIEHFGATKIVEKLCPFDFESYRAFLCSPAAQTKRFGRADKRKPLGPSALKGAILGTRSIFKYAFDEDMIVRPVKYGQGFDPPSAKVIRKIRNQKPKKMFEAKDIRAMFDLSGDALKAMILLGMNGGLGNTDCARMEFRHIDLPKQWLDYPRPKTGVLRWFPLWPETCVALEKWLRKRPEPINSAYGKYVFLTQKKRTPWTNPKGYDPICAATSKLLRTLEIDGQGLGFYTLRHIFQTIAEEHRDQKAVQFIMGHAPDSGDMSAHYRQEFSRERLMGVTEYVRRWLFAGAENKPLGVVPMVLTLPPDSIAVA